MNDEKNRIDENRLSTVENPFKKLPPRDPDVIYLRFGSEQKQNQNQAQTETQKTEASAKPRQTGQQKKPGKKRKRKLRVSVLAALVAFVAGILVLTVWLIGFFLYPHALLGQPAQNVQEHIQAEQTAKNQKLIQEIRSLEPGSALSDSSVLASTGNGTEGLDEEVVRAAFYSQPISDELANRLVPNVYDPNQDFVTLDDLQDIRVLYYDFSGTPKVGQLAANNLIAQDLEEIFYELYQQKYPIENVSIPFDLESDDESMAQDITRSLAFTWQDGEPMKHEHSLGLAVDFNPLYNPQVVMEDDQVYIDPIQGADYADRSVIQEHMIDENDPAYKAFTNHGFYWGGTWDGRNDYQHFEKYFNYDTGAIDLGVVNTETQQDASGQ